MNTDSTIRQIGFSMPAEEYYEFRELVAREYISCSRFALRAVRQAIRDVKRRNAQAEARKRRKAQVNSTVPATETATTTEA